MTMKRRILLILILAVICVISCVLCACNKDDIPGGDPIGWQTYLEDVATAITDDIDASGDTVNLNITGSVVINGTYFALTARANFDSRDRSRSNFAFIMKDGDGEVAFSVISDNVNTYIDIAQNPYIDNAKLKLQETNVFDYLGDLTGDDKEAFIESIRTTFIEFGKTVFNSADVSGDGSRVTFGINGEGVGTKLNGFFRSLTIIDRDISNVIKSILGIKDEGILSSLASAQGKVNFYLSGGSVGRIETEGLKINGADSEIRLTADIDGEYDQTVAQLFPKSDVGYKVTKVGSTSLDGAMSLVSSNGNRTAVKYNMSMNTNVDLIKLTFSGFDLDKLGEDNFFHFRLSHKCEANCTEYCASRVDEARGAVIDIAFSPTRFGTTNLYICLNLRSLLAKSYVERVARYDRAVSTSSIPEYAMVVIPASNLAGDSAFMRMIFQAYSQIMGIEIDKSESVGIGELQNAFADIPFAKALLDNMFFSEEFCVDALKFKVDQNIYGQARDYDIYKEVVYLKAYDEPEIKSYASALGKDYTAYSWQYEPRKTVDFDGKTYSLNNIYDIGGNNLLHGVNEAGDYVPMSDMEIEDLIGSALKLEYAGYGGVESTAFCEIVGVEGLDPDRFDEQEVILKVKYPNILDYKFEFVDIAEKVLEDLFGADSELFVQNVRAKIKLTRESKDSAFEFRSADTSAKYRLTHNAGVPDMLKATAKINYENGLKKEIVTIGTSESVIISSGIFSKQYSITEWGKVTVKFRVAGRSVERYFDVEKPDSFEFVVREASGEIGESCNISTYVTLRALYGQDKVNVKLTLKDFYINNISLDSPSSDWEHYYSYTGKYLVFTKSNDYSVKVRKCGIDFGELILHISSATKRTPTYQYNSGTEPQSVVVKDARNSFAGTITNKTHGDGEDTEYKLEVKVQEGQATNYGVSFNDADAQSYDIEFSAGGIESENGVINVVLPSLIIDPINVRLYVRFNESGVYRIMIKLNLSTVYQFTVTVL